MIDYKSVVRLVLKLFGLGLIIYAVSSLATFLPPLLAQRSEIGLLVSYFIPMAVPILLGAFLWFFPSRVANTIVRSDPASKSMEAGWAPELESIGVALLGLFLLYRAVSDLVYYVMEHQAKAAMLGNVRALDDFNALMTATIVEFVFALILMLRAEGIVSLLRKARGAGQH
jgi:hypothetical protein